MAHLIDRRLNGKNKSAVNRERFLRRFKAQIKQSVAKAIKGRAITDIQAGEKISIPSKIFLNRCFNTDQEGLKR